jgi:DNA invertase Pin-like site-specific DNA recombinase
VALVEQLSSRSSKVSSLVSALAVPSKQALRLPDSPPPAHQVQTRLAAAQVEQLVAEYQAGTTTRELAERYGINRVTVFEHLKRAGVPRRRPRKLRLVEIAKVVRLYVEGQSVEAVAQELRVGATTVRRVLQREGVELRRRGRRPGGRLPQWQTVT